MCDLINPIKYIADFYAIPQDYIDELVVLYETTSINILQHKISKYRNINDYKSYVYSIHDTYFNKWYIGVRYGVTDRILHNCLLDLQQYQSSSTDNLFKSELREAINKGSNRFVLSILKEFTDEFHAKLYEAFVHNIFKVGLQDDGKYNPLFYNKTAEYLSEHYVYTNVYWDIKNKVEVTYFDMLNNGVSYHAIYGVGSSNSHTTHDGRYCLKDNLCNIPELYLVRYTKINLYVILDDSGNWEIQTKMYKEWAELLGNDFHYLINPHKSVYSISNHFYLEEKLMEAILMCNKISLYVITDSKGNWEIQIKTIIEWRNIIGDKIYSLIGYNNYKRNKVGNYFYDIKYLYNELKLYEILELFYYDTRQIKSLKLTILEWNKKGINITNNYHKINTLTINNIIYYRSYKQCVEDNIQFTLINISNNSELIISKNMGNTLLGSNFHKLISGKYRNVGNYKLQQYNNLYESIQINL